MKYPWITPEIAEAATLRWVNKLRIKHKLESFDSLPRGNQGNPQSCVIANAVWDDCSVTGTHLKLGKRTFKLPICAQVFVYHFDRGNLPELIKTSTKQLKKLDIQTIRNVYQETDTKDAVETLADLVKEEEVNHEYRIKTCS